MNIKLLKSQIKTVSSITITGSKSESNRLLLLQALYPEIKIENLSNSDDSVVMSKALSSNSNTVVDIHHAGTAMRFLTAFFATQQGKEVTLTGSQRMKERPIQILVEALNQLGANISYLENSGCPPLLIKGKALTQNKISLKANVSSQYISALLLIAPKLEQGLELTLNGEITSIPYINMTLNLLNQIGVETSFKNNVITVNPLKEVSGDKTIVVESDWSSASYFYSIVALSPIGTQVELSSYKQDSLQGDSVLAELYQAFGVKTTFKGLSIVLEKTSQYQAEIAFDLVKSPDIAQTIAVTALGLGVKCDLEGLHTLKIKETDRLVALKNEIEKLGGDIEVTNETLHLKPFDGNFKLATIQTYNDHRMAMAFAPLALKTELKIEDAMVVSKSYPTFWDDLKSIGFQINQ
ncbi:3-phosphoshikimate 1-carboxyvinyltransferase [Gaetbulibacter jejuensis]|uniref:3-phosphoshikimate 1-carboxyvinyltransferase n=1 Tax=Gaetbulibacter jejuensis TaxID=584607 RepID=UPI0030090EDD